MAATTKTLGVVAPCDVDALAAGGLMTARAAVLRAALASAMRCRMVMLETMSFTRECSLNGPSIARTAAAVRKAA